MLASLADAPLVDPGLVYEPKYDGIRAIVEVGPQVRLWSRLGNDKTRQFPEIAELLAAWAARQPKPVELVLDGEIVALDSRGEPAGFQQLQGRIHLLDSAGARAGRDQGPSTALIVFDVLKAGRKDLRGLPFIERRAILERLLPGPEPASSPRAQLRISEIAYGDGRALYERALASGWEGLIAKQAESLYQSGKRTPDWRKLKIVQEQEFVIGGWTEPRHTRSYFGALLLGVYEPSAAGGKRLVYVGHTGTGFNERELARLMAMFRKLETSTCPFDPRPKTNERPHWLAPKLVAQVKFTEWTADGKLRHPVYLGLRDDKEASEIVREQKPVRASSLAPRARAGTTAREPADRRSDLVARLRELEDSRRDGVLELGDGQTLAVTNLHKIFWPQQKLTKGDLFRYYVQVAPFILPAVADRPLVMKRYPNGVSGKPFYQHRVDEVPKGVRVEEVGAEQRRQIVGGSLLSLLYMTQLAAISQDPWFSRVQSIESADYAALDLDPPTGASFDLVLDVARAVRDELAALDTTCVPKTSGADGLHVYIPLPPGTPYDAGMLFCQIVATVVSQKYPKLATVERSVHARGRRVYIDYLQNVLGKTLATAYSARASAWAGVSAPLTWQEIDDGVSREDFTIITTVERLRRVGDLWSALRTAKGADLSRVTRYASRTAGTGTRSPERMVSGLEEGAKSRERNIREKRRSRGARK